MAVVPGGAQNAPAPAVPQVPGMTPRQAIDAAAAALGGAERIRTLRNVTLIGYGQYAYQNGGGNITSLPGAPQKLIAANDYRRVYDLQNGRTLHQERRNDLFPFAAYGGHSFALARQGLDGAVAYNINEMGQATRGGDARDRRMWMHTNPVVAVRGVLDGATTVSNRRQEGELTLVDLTLREGDKLTMAIRPPSNLPAWIRWSGPNVNLGEVAYTTHFYGYVPYSDVRLPLGYTTKLDWRDVDVLKRYVDGYLIDTQRLTILPRRRHQRQDKVEPGAAAAQVPARPVAGRSTSPRSRAVSGASPAAQWRSSSPTTSRCSKRAVGPIVCGPWCRWRASSCPASP